MSAVEVELKLTIDPGAMRRLGADATTLTASAPCRRRLRSIYFDTPDLKLHRSGVALRARRVDGVWIQCVKFADASRHGLSHRGEIEQAIAKAEPDLDAIADRDVARRISKTIGEQALTTAFETIVWRTNRDFETSDGDTVELSVDRGEVTAGEATEPINEVELELKSGAPHALLTVAEALFGDRAFEIGTRSKADRGVALLTGDGDSASQPPEPSHGRRATLQRGIAVTDALAEIGSAASAQILDNWAVVTSSEDPEGPHQLRVGLRRLRSALRMLSPAFDSEDLATLSDAARDLGRQVGALRDADVLITEVVRPAAPDKHDKGFAALRKALETHRADARTKLRRALRSGEWSRLRLNCMMFDFAVARAAAHAHGAVARRKARPEARKALGKAWRKARRWGDKLDTLSIAERHEMRKALKTLRYGAEFFAPLFAERDAAEFVKRLKKLQDVFGFLNDVALTERLPAIASDFGAATARTDAAIRRIKAHHEQRAKDAWRKARKRWRDLDAADKFWRG